MYKITHQGKAFNLGNSTFPAEWVNQWLLEPEEKFNADFTWEFSLPYTPENKAILGALAEPQLQTSSEDFIMCTLEIAGDAKPIKMYVGAVSRDAFKVRCILNEGSFDVMQKNLNALDLELDSPINVFLLANAVYPDSFHNAYYPDAQVCWPPLISNDFLSSEEPEFLGKINAYSEVDGKYLDNYLDVSTPINRNAMAPQPFLCWVLERGFAEMGLTPTGEAWDAEFVRRMFLFSNFAVEDFNTQTQNVTLTQAAYSNPSGQTHSLDKTVVNGINFTSGTNFDTATDTWTVQSTGKVYVLLDFTFTRTNSSNPSPEWVKLNLYNTVQDEFLRIPLTGEGQSLPDGQHDFIWSRIIPESWDGDTVRFYLSDDLGNTITITDITLTITQESSDTVNTFGTFSGFEKGLPDMTFGELLTELGKAPFGMKFEPDFTNAIMNVSFKTGSLFEREFVDVTLKEFPEVERVVNKYHWTYEEPSGDRFLDDLRPDWLSKAIRIENGAYSLVDYSASSDEYIEIVQAISPIAQSLGTTKALRIEVPAQSEYYATDGEAPSPRVGFYHGKVNDVPRADIYFVNYSDEGVETFSFDHEISTQMFDKTSLPWLKWRTSSTNLKLTMILEPVILPSVVEGKRINLQWGPAVISRASAELDRDSRRIEMDAEVILL